MDYDPFDADTHEDPDAHFAALTLGARFTTTPPSTSTRWPAPTTSRRSCAPPSSGRAISGTDLPTARRPVSRCCWMPTHRPTRGSAGSCRRPGPHASSSGWRPHPAAPRRPARTRPGCRPLRLPRVVAAPLPATMIAELVGVPVEDRDRFRAGPAPGLEPLEEPRVTSRPRRSPPGARGVLPRSHR